MRAPLVLQLKMNSLHMSIQPIFKGKRFITLITLVARPFHNKRTASRLMVLQLLDHFATEVAGGGAALVHLPHVLDQAAVERSLELALDAGHKAARVDLVDVEGKVLVAVATVRAHVGRNIVNVLIALASFAQVRGKLARSCKTRFACLNKNSIKCELLFHDEKDSCESKSPKN